MKKSDLAKIVATKKGYNVDEVEEIMDAILNEIADAMKNGEAVKIHGFGNFYPRYYGERNCYNPITGKIMKLNKSVQPAFNPGNKLRTYLNNTGEM